MNKDVGLLINASRAVIFASAGEDFAEAAASAASRLRGEMRLYL
jgi:orotidine-5'-phosphate decarboxylase